MEDKMAARAFGHALQIIELISVVIFNDTVGAWPSSHLYYTAASIKWPQIFVQSIYKLINVNLYFLLKF